MLEQALQDTAGEPEGLAAQRLAFLGDLGAKLTGPGDPLDLLGQSLPRLLALSDAESGRVLARTEDRDQMTCLAAMAWPNPERRRNQSLLRIEIPAAERPAGLIEVRCQGGPGQAVGDSAAAFLEALASLTGLALAKAAAEEDQAKQRQIGRDLKLAAELQRSLQPDSDPALMPIWGVNLPARKLSGDFFDYFQLGDESIAFALGDVSGKGTNAALLMAKTVSLFRCLAKRIDSPAALLEALNEELCETATRGMFVTMVAGHYRKDSGQIVFANAGHQPPLLRRPDRSYDTFPAKAPPLGITRAIALAEEEIQPDGGEFYVFSDGLTEYRYASGEELGVDGLIQLLEAHAEAPIAGRLQLLLETLDAEAGWEARDDLTVLAIDDAWVRAGAGAETTADAAPLEAAS